MRKLLTAILANLMLLLFTAASADWQDMPYWIGVDRLAQRATVYRTEDNGVVYQWRCSTGKATPHGEFLIPQGRSGDRSDQIFISGGDGTYFIWRTPIIGSILFHTYLFDSKDINDIIVSTVDGLGTNISHGCIRLPVDAARWIAQNCFEGTKVVIHDGRSDPYLTAMLGEGTPAVPDRDFENAPTAVALNTSHCVVEKDHTITLQAELKPAGAVNKITWVSSNRNVAAVSQSGVVKGIKSGVVTVYAVTENALVAACTVEVNDPNEVRRIELNTADEITINKDETLQLEATIVPSTAPRSLRWSSSKPTVAAVSANGLITAKKSGTTTVACKAANGVRRTIIVHVYDPSLVQELILEPADVVTINKGETLQISAVILPDTAVKTLTWSSSQPKIASVNANGAVTAIRAGTAVITCKAANGVKTKLTVHVYDPTIPTSVALDTSELTLNVGDTYALKTTVLPDTAVTGLTWTSSNSARLAVSADGVLSAKKEGTATVAVKTSNGLKTTVRVTVTDVNPSTAVMLDRAGTVSLAIGETLPLHASLQPEGARTWLTWSSSSSRIASVSQSGVVTALKAGTSRITVTDSRGHKASMTVSVYDSRVPTSVRHDPAGDLVVQVGEPVQLSAVVLPDTAVTTLTWTSSSTKVASVSRTGLLKPLRTGRAVITVKTANGKSARLNVQVIAKILAQQISIDQLKTDEQGNELPLILTAGDAKQLTCSAAPSGAQPSLTWKTDNADAVTVSADGYLKTVGEGTAVITVQTDNGLSARITVVVLPAEEPEQPAGNEDPGDAAQPNEPEQPAGSEEPAATQTDLDE